MNPEKNPRAGRPIHILLVNPRNPENFWTMQSTVRAVGAKSLMPNSALATLMALTPPEVPVKYSYCDENLGPVDRSLRCDLAAVTGYALHADRIRDICADFRARGIPVALGGVFATLYPGEAKMIADHVFTGEAEYNWPKFLRDWHRDVPEALYEQPEHVDLNDSPPPEWSHIRSGDYLYFTVQTSRGCPNNCDFCDAIRIVGRRYRTKSIPRIMQEVQNAYDAGAETVFFSEDNFFVNRAFTVELLNELIRWNRSVRAPLSFSCQATVKVGEDEEILRLMADAKFSVVFLGVETVRPECLKEVNKGHLAKVDPYRSVMNISAHGILPFVGLIVGFDHDDGDTFAELDRYIEDTATPFASITVLCAPEHTVLYERMKKQGRISGDFDGKWHFSTNIVPRQLTMVELLSGHRALFRDIYTVDRFEKRALRWLENIRYFPEHYGKSKMRFSKMLKFFNIIIYYTFRERRQVRSFFFRFLRESWKINPRHFKKAITIMSQYCHHHNFAESASWQGIDGAAR